MTTLFRGSTWHKWDLHVHSPATYGGNYADFIRNLNSSEADVIGINDYCTIEGYEQILSNDLTKPQKPLFPVVEFRMNNMVLDKNDPRLKKGARINFHIIFDNDPLLAPRIRNWLNSLDCLREGGSRDKLGNTTCSDDRLKLTVDYFGVIESLHGDDKLRDRSLVWLPYDEYGGIDSIDPENDGYFKLGLINKADVIGSANQKQVDFFLWRHNKHAEANIKRWLNGRRLPCIKGSDAHKFNYPFGRLQNQDSEPIERYCWIKAEPTFEGLKQVLYEPEDRVIIGSKSPALFNHAVVGAFAVSKGADSFFLRNIVACNFNPGLNCIIGSRGSGKSTFLDAMALSLGNKEVLRRDRNNYVGHFFERNDTSSLRSIVKHSSSGDEELLTLESSRTSGFVFDSTGNCTHPYPLLCWKRSDNINIKTENLCPASPLIPSPTKSGDTADSEVSGCGTWPRFWDCIMPLIYLPGKEGGRYPTSEALSGFLPPCILRLRCCFPIISMNSERRSARKKDKLIFNTGMNETTPKAVPFTPKTEGDSLAIEIAKAFNDETSLPKYQRLCTVNDLAIVKRIFQEVQRIPQEKIKRSRAALFTYLVKKYAKR